MGKKNIAVSLPVSGRGQGMGCLPYQIIDTGNEPRALSEVMSGRFSIAL